MPVALSSCCHELVHELEGGLGLLTRRSPRLVLGEE